MVTEDSAAHLPFALMSGGRSGASEAERERRLKRIGAAVAVGLIHVLFLAVLFTAGRYAALREKHEPKEVIFILPPLAPETKKNPTKPLEAQTPVTKPTEAPPHTITLPPPTPQTQSATDVMQALGRELACGAGSYEHLSQTQREACRRQPWKFKKNSKNVIVLDVPPKLEEEKPALTGAEHTLHEQQTTDACVAAGNTHSECIHKTIFGR